MRSRDARACVLAFLHFCILAFACAACGSSAAPPDVHETVVWDRLGAWSGHANMQTESFLGQVGALRLRWETHAPATPGGGSFHLTVHSAVSGRTMADAVTTTGAGSGTAFVSDDPHMFYLVIEAKDLQWSVIVEEPVTRRTAAR
jgi:hypothetical protein